MNNAGHGVSQAYKHSITIHNVGSPLCLSEHLRAPPSSIIFILSGRGGISPSACAIWPKRKRPEYMNKGTGLPQAELKLLYYIAPFEISVGGSGRPRTEAFSLFSLLFFHLSFVSLCYKKHSNHQVSGKSAVKLWHHVRFMKKLHENS